jgi:formamidopyrimidine-DNA glycosylase
MVMKHLNLIAMPELPEVETFKKYFDSTSLNQVIDDVEIIDDRILIASKKNFIKCLIGGKFEETIRHGKYLLAKVRNCNIVFHFGMSGWLEYFSSEESEPKYSKVIFRFNNGYSLAYISIRMFGKLDLADSLEKFQKGKRLGPDAYNMSFNEFQNAIKKRTAIMKSALLDQSIISGIGNIYSDEILYKAKIHPKRKINTLNENELEMLFNSIKDVLEYGIKHEGELDTYSNSFLIPHRSKEERCPECGSFIERYEISGRHGFYCPKCQPI